MLSYKLTIENAKTHQFKVKLIVPNPIQKLRVSLPVWIPGSYLVREFSKHLSHLTAQQGGKSIAITQLDKHTWELDNPSGTQALELSWQVYAFDTSVRAAYLDQRRGFINGSSVFLRPHGFEEENIQLQIDVVDPHLKGWDYACVLPPAEKTAPIEPTNKGCLATLIAQNYDELVDSPIELGQFWRAAFEISGVVHELIVTGAPHGFDGKRLLLDTQKICEQTIRFWQGDLSTPASNPSLTLPYARYIFMLNAVDNSYGGLEHKASTALICKREDLPFVKDATDVAEVRRGYQNLLTLITHEFFHVWHVKHMRPAEFKAYDYGQENYTELLWFFEGATSYYEYILLRRAGLLTQQQTLDCIAKDISSLEKMQGRKVQTVAQASFDAWVKFYRVDENTLNSTVSYYVKGALVALCLDLTLRQEGKGSLDEVMRWLWQNSQGGPIKEADILTALQHMGGRSYQAEISAWVHGRVELPVEILLQQAGVQIHRDVATVEKQLGLVLQKKAEHLHIKTVSAHGPAEKAGLAAGDELIAINDWRITDLSQWKTYASNPDEAVQILFARDAQMMHAELLADLQAQGEIKLSMNKQRASLSWLEEASLKE